MTDKPAVTTMARDEEQGSMPWPELIAVTLLLVFIAAIASGWFDLMLPWKGTGS